MKNSILLILAFIAIGTVNSCINIKNPYPAMIPGIYQGKLLLAEDPYAYLDENAIRKARVAQFPGLQEDEVPFNFEVKYNDDNNPVIVLYNSEERIELDEITYGTERSTAHDTFRVEFPEYNSYIYAEFSENVMQGYFRRTDVKDYKIPFVAKYGKSNRFPEYIDSAKINVDGIWDVEITRPDSSSYKAIGQFKQDGNKLTGTFATAWGDYRFLEGVVTKDKMYLSTFDGIHVYLFGAKLSEDETLNGFFRSGSKTIYNWSAVRKDDVTLQDADSMSVSKEIGNEFFRKFPTADGGEFSLDSGDFKGKPKVMEVMGTWCPNCKDATAFLKQYISENEEIPVEFVAVSYEKEQNKQEALAKLKYYKEKHDIPYPIAYGGFLDAESRKSIPWIDEIRSYPTLIFFNHKNEVIRVYTGFYGPATNEYAAFSESFDETIKELINDYEK